MGVIVLKLQKIISQQNPLKNGSSEIWTYNLLRASLTLYAVSTASPAIINIAMF
jgi:hypothetical protein